MSIPAINWCIEQKGMPPGQWVVLFHLCHAHNHETGRCDPSQAYLAEMTGMGERTVRRHLSDLEKDGLIERRKRGVEGGGRVSDFFILKITTSYEPANLAANHTGQSVRTNRPNRAEKVHEMAAKQEVTGKNRETPREILCQVLSEEATDAYIEHRRSKRAKLTERAAELIVKKLNGHPSPDAVIEESIANGWTGVFPDKGGGGRQQAGQGGYRHSTAQAWRPGSDIPSAMFDDTPPPSRNH